MKKIFFLLAITVVFNTVNSQSQPVFPDGGFENKWVTLTSTFNNTDYDDYSVGNTELMHTLNSLYAYEGQEFRTELTAFKETNSHSGQYAMRLTTSNFASMLLVPGAFATLSPDFIAEFVSGGGKIGIVHQFNGKPKHLKGFYKYEPIAGDSAAIEIAFYNFDVPIASEKLIIKGTTSEWTWFDIPIHYTINAPVTDLKLIFASSAAYDFDNLFDCHGQFGSSLFIDDIEFDYITGITQPLLGQVSSNAYPIPASDKVTIEIEKEYDGNLVIYNMLGAEVFQTAFSGSKIECNTANLQSGNYFYRIINENKIYSTGRIVIK